MLLLLLWLLLPHWLCSCFCCVSCACCFCCCSRFACRCSCSCSCANSCSCFCSYCARKDWEPRPPSLIQNDFGRISPNMCLIIGGGRLIKRETIAEPASHKKRLVSLVLYTSLGFRIQSLDFRAFRFKVLR